MTGLKPPEGSIQASPDETNLREVGDVDLYNFLKVLEGVKPPDGSRQAS